MRGIGPIGRLRSRANLTCGTAVSSVGRIYTFPSPNPGVDRVPFVWPSVSRFREGGLLPLLVVVVALSWAEIASAGCGSHVTPAGRMESRHACEPGLDCPALPAAPAPCNGPGCSRAPDTPPLAPS